MTSTNYMSPQDFKKMVDAIPLVTEYNNGNMPPRQERPVPNPKEIQACLYIQYCHALRVSEALAVEKEDFNIERRILTLHRTKTGFKNVKGVKTRKKQYTSIPADFPLWALNYLPFKINRQVMWRYVKQAAKWAGLEIAEQQDERFIDGAWTHLIRKSRAKWMIEQGASEVMVKVKLRHTFSVTERYTKPDINALIKWEEENCFNPEFPHLDTAV